MNYPTELESERAAIACALVGGLNRACELAESVKQEWFFNRDCETAFKVISGMAAAGKPVNLDSFARECQTQGQGVPFAVKFNADVTSLPSAASLPMHVEAIRDAWQRRHILTVGTQLASDAQDQTKPISETRTEAQNSLEFELEPGALIQNGHEAAKAMLDDLEARHNRGDSLTGLETGFSKLDALTDGLQAGELFIFGARPAKGKTAFGVGLACHACLTNRVPTLFVTGEMKPTAIYRRMMACATGTDLYNVKRGLRSEGDFARASRFAATLNKSPFFMLNGVAGLGANSLASTIRSHARRHGVRLVVLDYLQLVKSSERHEKRTYEHAEVCQVLKGAAVANDVHIFSLAQLTRDYDKDTPRQPRLCDLADSASLERFADVVALLDRREVKNKDDTIKSICDLVIAKQRDGQCGVVPLRFLGHLGRFEEPEAVQTGDLPV